MLFYKYISDFNIVLDPLDYFEIALWILVCITYAVVGLVFIMASRKNKPFLFPGLFFIFNIGTRIVRLISKFVVGHEYGYMKIEGPQLILSFFYLFFTYIAAFFYYQYLEKDILKKSHHFFSIMVIFVIIIGIFNYFYSIAFYFLLIPFFIVVLGVPGCYLYMAWISTGEIRRNAIIIMIALILIFFGIMLDTPVPASIFARIPGMTEFAKLGAPILQIIGALLYRSSFHLKAKDME